MNKIKRTLFINKCHLYLWIGKWYTKFIQVFGCSLKCTPQQRREQKRMVIQVKHYNKDIIGPGQRYRSVVLGGRRF